MTEPRTIATVTARNGYDGLNVAFRARAEELNITRDDIDVLGSLTRGHGSKLLAPYPIKAIGRTTLGPILHALKLKLLVVVDDAIVWQEEPRGRRIKRGAMLHTLEHRPGNMQESRTLQAKFVRELLRKHGRRALRLARAARNIKLSPAQRRKIAKHAAKMRWHKPKPARIAHEK